MSTTDGRWWDEAWSLVEGCTKVSESCANCWAEAQTHVRSHQSNPKILARYGGLTEDGRFTGQVRMMEADLDKPRRIKKPTIFSVWNDLFHEGVSVGFIERAFRTMRECPQHYFLVCTKRPERAGIVLKTLRCAPLPTNYGLGTTLESDKHFDRLNWLLKAPAPMRFVSIEPLLGFVDIGNYLCRAWVEGGLTLGTYLDWVIVGAESGRRPRFTDYSNVFEVVLPCLESGTPVWVKQLQRRTDSGGRDVTGLTGLYDETDTWKATHDMNFFPERLRVRQWPKQMAEFLSRRVEVAG